ncbi:hypothetical protein lerEdw1_020006 [Lerista edwardsae]|nr:hypothetical protein lerEdw1_020006 [Lerista edwardsae]
MSLPAYFLCLLTLSSACYIQNCPRGGKRAFPDADVRQCIPCGPGNRGNCFGPSICCGEELGCYLGTSETLQSCTMDVACVDENGNRSRASSERNLTMLDSSAGDLLLKLMHLASLNRPPSGKQ